MRALWLLPLLAACSTPDAEIVPGSHITAHGPTNPADVAAQTTLRTETLKLAESAYDGAIMGATKALTSGISDDQLQQIGAAQGRADDAIDFLRTLDAADEQTFTWALHFYNVAIFDLNRAVESGEMEAIHAH